MKICFLVTDIFIIGGVQRVTTVLANKLSEFHNIEIVCMEKSQSNSTIYDLNKNICVRHINLPNESKSKEFIYRKLRGLNRKTNIINKIEILLKEIYYPKSKINNIVKFINDNNYDIVIGVEGIFSLLLGIINKKITAKTIGWYHNSYEAYFCNKQRYYWNMDLLFKKYINNLDECVVLTEHDKICNKDKMNLDSITIYNPLSFYSDKKSSCNKNIVLCVARLVKYQKGLDLLIEAFAKVIKKEKDWKLLIIGDGPDKEKLEIQIKDKMLQNNIKILNHEDDIKKYYLNASIFVSPSRWEGFGLVITEAMECGLPIIAYENSGPKEIIGENNEAGILIESENIERLSEEICSLIKDKEKRLYLSSKSIERARDFDIDKIADRWNSIFNKLYHN